MEIVDRVLTKDTVIRTAPAVVTLDSAVSYVFIKSEFVVMAC